MSMSWFRKRKLEWKYFENKPTAQGYSQSSRGWKPYAASRVWGAKSPYPGFIKTST